MKTMERYMLNRLGLFVILGFCAMSFSISRAETYTVPNDKPVKVTTGVLEAGRVYNLTASGVISDWADKQDGVDPVWCYAQWRCGPSGIPWQQLRINGKGMIELAEHDLPYNSGHTYTIRIKGEGRPLELWCHDALGSHGDNKGAFTVTISSGAGAGPSTGDTDFASEREALEWLERNHPYQASGAHWRQALNDPKFDRFQKNLYRQDPDAFHKFKDRALRRHEFWPGQKDMERVPGSASKDYFCHDFAWRIGADRKKPVDPNHPLAEGKKHIEPSKVVADPDKYGFEKFTSVGKLRAGDIVVYFNDSWDNPSHSAVVVKVNPQGARSGHDIHLMSKDVDNSLFKHRLGSAGSPDYFYDNFAGKGVLFYRPLPGAQH